MNTKEQFGQRLALALDHIGVEPMPIARKRHLSKLMDITERQAGNYLNGIKMPTPEGLSDLATKLGINPNWLISGIGPMLPISETEERHIYKLRTLNDEDRDRLYRICDAFQPYSGDKA